MKAGNPPKEWSEKKAGKVVKVPSRRLDDIMYNKVKPNALKGLENGNNPPNIDKVFALKVDTQGNWYKYCIHCLYCNYLLVTFTNISF